MTKENMENNLAEAYRNLREVKEHLDKKPQENGRVRDDIGRMLNKLKEISDTIHYL